MLLLALFVLICLIGVTPFYFILRFGPRRVFLQAGLIRPTKAEGHARYKANEIHEANYNG